MARYTGFSDDDKSIIMRRCYGVCEICNLREIAHLHHRKPRRMGGRTGAASADVNRPSNGLGLCHQCHNDIEHGNRAEAKERGLILNDQQDPAKTPLFLRRYLGWVTLDDEGTVAWHQDYEHAVKHIQEKNEHL